MTKRKKQKLRLWVIKTPQGKSIHVDITKKAAIFQMIGWQNTFTWERLYSDGFRCVRGAWTPDKEKPRGRK